MGRPSKLSDREWAEIGRRLANNESQSKLAKEFKVSRASIIARFSDRVSDIRDAGMALAGAELLVERLPVADRVSARAFADQVKGIQNDYAETTALGIKAAKIIQCKVLAQAQALPDIPSPEDLKPIMAGSATTNSLSSMATSMLSSKSRVIDDDPDSSMFTPDVAAKMLSFQKTR